MKPVSRDRDSQLLHLGVSPASIGMTSGHAMKHCVRFCDAENRAAGSRRRMWLWKSSLLGQFYDINDHFSKIMYI